jgi:hypothetical protein
VFGSSLLTNRVFVSFADRGAEGVHPLPWLQEEGPEGAQERPRCVHSLTMQYQLPFRGEFAKKNWFGLFGTSLLNLAGVVVFLFQACTT